MIISVLVLAIFSYAFSFFLPSVYVRQKRKFIESSAELANESESVCRFPLLSLLIFLLPALIYYLSSNLLVMAFCFFLAIAAYTDVSKRWIPDFIIYILLAISVYSLQSKDLALSLFAMTFYLMPVVILSFYGYLKKKESWVASGDYYIFPSIGLMLIPDYAAGVMLFTLTIMLILIRWIKQIPLVTIAYFTFIGFNVCLFSGLL